MFGFNADKFKPGNESLKPEIQTGKTFDEQGSPTEEMEVFPHALKNPVGVYHSDMPTAEGNRADLRAEKVLDKEHSLVWEKKSAQERGTLYVTFSANPDTSNPINVEVWWNSLSVYQQKAILEIEQTGAVSREMLDDIAIHTERYTPAFIDYLEKQGAITFIAPQSEAGELQNADEYAKAA